MNNIEKLAIEHGAKINESQDVIFDTDFDKTGVMCLKAFAKAYAQQQSEPVALPTFNEISKNIDDSRFVGHPKLSALDTNNVKTGARIMYDAIYVWLKKQNPPASVPLEKYNKLLEAYKSAIQSIDDYDCYDRKTGEPYFKHEIFKWDLEFISEIEGKNEQSINSN